VKQTISHLLHAVPYFPVFNSGRVNVVCTDLSEGWDNTVASRRRGGTSRRKNGKRLRDMYNVGTNPNLTFSSQKLLFIAVIGRDKSYSPFSLGV